MIDTGDFLVGLVLEDQGMLEEIFSSILEGQGTPLNTVPSHIPFFSARETEELLANLKKSLPQSQPIALNTELPLSASLERVFGSVKSVQTRFRHSQVEPLHLLAAVLTEEADHSVKLLQDSGITLEKVLLTLSSATGN